MSSADLAESPLRVSEVRKRKETAYHNPNLTAILSARTPTCTFYPGANVEHLIPTLKSVSEIIDEFSTENLAVPEIQRDVVWDADQIKSLIDSITHGYPCGSLIYWEPRERDKQLVRSMIRPERANSVLPRYFLLDGQQRVTALASVLLKRARAREILVEMEDDLPYVFANLKRFPREFEATTDPAGYHFPWVLLNSLFDGSYRHDSEFANLSSEVIQAVQSYVQRLRDYKFPVQIIRDRDYATVAEIFTRVNSAGTQLTGAEIHLARVVPYWQGITREFRNYRRELIQKNYDLDLHISHEIGDGCRVQCSSDQETGRQDCQGSTVASALGKDMAAGTKCYRQNGAPPPTGPEP